MTHPSYSSGSRAFTLLEIMVVLLLLSMLMGLGVGAFSKIGGGPTMAAGRIKDVLRTARFQAVREKAESAVRVDPVRNTITGLGWKNVGSVGRSIAEILFGGTGK